MCVCVCVCVCVCAHLLLLLREPELVGALCGASPRELLVEGGLLPLQRADLPLRLDELGLEEGAAGAAAGAWAQAAVSAIETPQGRHAGPGAGRLRGGGWVARAGRGA